MLRQREGYRAAMPHRQTPGRRRLVSVGRTEHRQAWDSLQAHEVLHRLMGGAILAESYTIVSEDEDGVRLHQRCQAQGRTHVVGEGQEVAQ